MRISYKPIIKFASRERAQSPLEVLYMKHYTATFPKIYKTQWGATNYARKQIVVEELDFVWQLPGAMEVQNTEC